MEIRADLNVTACVPREEFAWVASPLPGVDRVMLDRVGAEVAVATSIVRYAPGSQFDAHGHALGEEFIVLDGMFSDEHGDFPAGSYVRNPPGTSHTPHSDPGCIIFVKLRQFDEDDLTQMYTQIEPARSKALYRYQDEVVETVHIPAGQRHAFDASYYVRELLVLSGSVTWQQDITRTLTPWSWIRMQPGQPLRIVAQEDALVFSKTRPIYREPEIQS